MNAPGGNSGVSRGTVPTTNGVPGQSGKYGGWNPGGAPPSTSTNRIPGAVTGTMYQMYPSQRPAEGNVGGPPLNNMLGAMQRARRRPMVGQQPQARPIMSTPLNPANINATLGPTPSPTQSGTPRQPQGGQPVPNGIVSPRPQPNPINRRPPLNTGTTPGSPPPFNPRQRPPAMPGPAPNPQPVPQPSQPSQPQPYPAPNQNPYGTGIAPPPPVYGSQYGSDNILNLDDLGMAGLSPEDQYYLAGQSLYYNPGNQAAQTNYDNWKNALYPGQAPSIM